MIKSGNLRLFFNKTLTITGVFLMLFVFGCQQQKSEKPSDNNTQETPQQTEPKVNNDTVKSTQPVIEEQQPKVESIDLTGKWTGILDSRATVLQITKQTGNEFSGKITISYKKPLHQEVTGKFDPDKLTFTMTDQLHSKFMGKYSGSLSADKSEMKGTFTVNYTKKNYSFKLNKK